MPRARKQDKDGIFQRPDSPYWWVSIPNGRGGTARRSSRVPITDDPQGLKAAAVRARLLAEGPPTAPPGEAADTATFDGLMLAYLAEVTPQKQSPERDKYSARRLFPHFTGRLLSEIGAAEVRAYLRSRTAEGAEAGTINRELGLASAAWSWGRRELELPIGNPWTSRRLREPPGRRRHLTEDEAERLLRAAQEARRAPYLHAWACLCLYAGLRPGEALRLRWDHVDLSRRLLHFQEADQKSGKAAAVPLNDRARAALLERARWRAAHCPGAEWVICRADGRPVGSIKKAFRAAVERAGLSDLHPHDLRRTFGSWLVQRGVGIERVSKLLRHADVRITAAVYAHLRDCDLADAAAALDEPGNRYRTSREDFTLNDPAIPESSTGPASG
jgi:integrase